jgi:hypothetical protein
VTTATCSRGAMAFDGSSASREPRDADTSSPARQKVITRYGAGTRVARHAGPAAESSHLRRFRDRK